MSDDDEDMDEETLALLDLESKRFSERARVDVGSENLLNPPSSEEVSGMLVAPPQTSGGGQVEGSNQEWGTQRRVFQGGEGGSNYMNFSLQFPLPAVSRNVPENSRGGGGAPFPAELEQSLRKQISDCQQQLAFQNEEIREVQRLKRELAKAREEKAELESQISSRAKLSEHQQQNPGSPERAHKRRRNEEAFPGPFLTSADPDRGEPAGGGKEVPAGTPDRSYEMEKDGLVRRAVVTEIWESSCSREDMRSLSEIGRKITEGMAVDFDFPVDRALLRKYTSQLMDLRLTVPIQSVMQASVELAKSIASAGLSPEKRQPNVEGRKLHSAVKLLLQVLEVLSCLVDGMNHPGAVDGGGADGSLTGVVDLLGCLVKLQGSWVLEDFGFSFAVVKLAGVLGCCPGDLISPEVFGLLLSKGLLERNLQLGEEEARIRVLEILLLGEFQFQPEISEAERMLLSGVLDCIFPSCCPPPGIPAPGGDVTARNEGGFGRVCRKAFQLVAKCLMEKQIDCIRFLVEEQEAEGAVGLLPRVCERLRVTLDSVENLERRDCPRKKSSAIQQHLGVLFEGLRIIQSTMRVEEVRPLLVSSIKKNYHQYFCSLQRLEGMSEGCFQDEVVRFPSWVFSLGSSRKEKLLSRGLIPTLKSLALTIRSKWMQM